MPRDADALKRLDKKKKEISNLRTELNRINDLKEKCFSEKEKISSEIKQSINQIKGLKESRNNYTKEVKALKSEKEKLVDDIKKKIEEIKKLKKERSDYAKKHNLQGDPGLLRKKIKAMETKIETEVISFDQEQKLMKSIRSLKQQAEGFGEITKVIDRIQELSKAIDGMKAKEKELKKQIKSKAQESQKDHEQMLEISKKVDELRVKEKEHYDGFLEHKKEFTELNEKIKGILGELGDIQGSVSEIKEKKKRAKQEKDRMTIDQKKSVVREKMKKGEKLTTEDLLIFQRD